MARLNETLAPTESIDALKRRFLRQNREIARANSMQSLKIRSLETETARLLAENIAFREQIIKLETGLSRHHAQQLYRHVDRVKARLDEKVRQLGQAITELGQLQYQYGPQSLARKSVSSVAEKSWRNGLPPLEAPRRHLEGTLPTILEDKPYPRWTWSSGDILDLLPRSTGAANTNDSPDLGPPPVAHFEAEDVSRGSSRNNRDDQSHRSIPEPSALTASIELRRKRRESANVFEFKKSSGSDSTNSQRIGLSPGRITDDSSYPLKTGARRRLSSKDEERTGSWRDTEVKDLKTTGSAIDLWRKENEGLAEAFADDGGGGGKRNFKSLGTARSREPSQSKDKWRPALQPRSTNTDPSSPSKQSKAIEEVDEVIVKPKFLTRDSSLTRKRDPKPPPSAAGGAVPQPEGENSDTRRVEQEDTIMIKQKEEHSEPYKKDVRQESQPEPETPADSHTFPWTSSESLVTHVDPTDTPIPLEPRGDGAIAGVRPSRRPRAGINYAEPNLRDKMRRPTKEFVDAVTGEGKTQQKSNQIKREDGLSEHEERAMSSSSRRRSLVIKREDEQRPSSSSSWKDLPFASRSQDNLSDARNRTESEPLTLRSRLSTSGARSGSPPLSSQPTAEEAGAGAGQARSYSRSQIAIPSSLMGRTAGSRRAGNPNHASSSSNSPEDSPQASPLFLLTPEGATPPDRVAASSSTIRLARRHSTIGNSSRSTSLESSSSSGDIVRPTRARLGGHRRTHTVAVDGNLPSSLLPPPRRESPPATEEEDLLGRSGRGLPTRSASTGRTMGALERAAARRRSMML